MNANPGPAAPGTEANRGEPETLHGTILVTGGCGFIGSNFLLDWFETAKTPVVNVDKLTYAAHPESLAELAGNPAYTFVAADICDGGHMSRLLEQYRPRAIVHFAAETHVDRSILGPEVFVRTNVQGTVSLLEATRVYLATLPLQQRGRFRFVHISTDEVYGSLVQGAPPATEQASYAPSSPYAASKAAADHLVRAWYRTYGVPALLTNCSNNYGSFQFPEKLIPLMIESAMTGRELPVYGDGQQVRDWLYVRDHCAALRLVLAHGRPGQTYNIGTGSECTNLEVVRTICGILDELLPGSPHRPHANLIRFVEDRAGHDRRYALDTAKIRHELGWTPATPFASGLRRTVEWYLGHREWVRTATARGLTEWIEENYGSRGAFAAGEPATRSAPPLETRSRVAKL